MRGKRYFFRPLIASDSREAFSWSIRTGLRRTGRSPSSATYPFSISRVMKCGVENFILTIIASGE